jgi:short-subunit dehydrogenase
MARTGEDIGNVWVVGASSGIGEAFSRLIDTEATNVAISARSHGKLEKLQSDGVSLHSFPVDVTSPEEMTTTAQAIEARFGSIDLVVICSGLWALMPSDRMDIEKMRAAMDVNYFGVVNTVNAVLPVMKTGKGGHIVIVSSVAGYRGLPNAIAYGPTKAALMNLAETLKIDLDKFGINVSLVNPGFVDTQMTQSNKFFMPGLISTDLAAQRMLAGIKSKRFSILFPTVFANIIRSFNILPNWLFFWGARRMFRK